MRIIQQHNHLLDAANSLSKEMLDSEGLAEKILTSVVLETIKKYQQKLNVGIQDSISELLDDFKQKITQAIFDTEKSWRPVNEDPFLLPRNCRFCLKKGRATVVLIEQEPQVRSLAIDRETSGVYSRDRFALAMPFSVFLVHFIDGNFANLYVGWRTSPLGSIDDMVVRPILPNIHENLAVCTGMLPVEARATPSHRSAPRNGPGRKPIATQVDAIVSHFWLSSFNDDLADHWHNRNRVDSRLVDVVSWENSSKSDPLFILDVAFPVTSSRTVRTMLDRLTAHEETPDESRLRHNFSETIDKSAESFFNGILRFLKKTKFEKYHPNDVTEILTRMLTRANGEMADVLFALKHELEELKNHSGLYGEARAKPVTVRKAGAFWNEDSLEVE